VSGIGGAQVIQRKKGCGFEASLGYIDPVLKIKKIIYIYI
jgi:hypothetical protein